MNQSWKRFSLVILAVLACLSVPSIARADGITFGFVEGRVFAQRPIGGSNPSYVTNDHAVNSAIPKSAVTRMSYVTRFNGTAAPGIATTPTLGSTTYPNAFNFGNVLFQTGTLQSTSGTTLAYFNAGGYVKVFANSTMALATGGTVPNGSLMFMGSFSDVTTFAQTNFPLSLASFITQRCGVKPTQSCTNTNTAGYSNNYLPNFLYQFTLSGPVSGTLSSGVLSYFHLGSSAFANGLFSSSFAGFQGPGKPAVLKGSLGSFELGTASVVVPEPGTLSLLGTGLAAMVGLLRRRRLV